MLRFSTAAALLLALTVTSAAAADKRHDAGEKASDKPDAMVCKRFVETGSLVGSKRVCKTKADWERDRAEMRDGFSPTQICSKAGDGSAC